MEVDHLSIADEATPEEPRVRATARTVMAAEIRLSASPDTAEL
jgi:hypothetical protein